LERKTTKEKEKTMQTTKIQTRSRDELFREKARTYILCYSTQCPLCPHCLHALLTAYAPTTLEIATCVNLNNPAMQTEGCPMYKEDRLHQMPVGLASIYYDMPGRMERDIKQRLISRFSRKTYYEYHNGSRPLTPAVEQIVRQVAAEVGWHEELQFAGYVENFDW
jgi:hypothetical protein